MKYTYRYTHPNAEPKKPFRTTIRFTRGEFICITKPIGTFGFKYAVFQRRLSQILIPVHDLTPETKQTVADILTGREQ
jgi:hypothetical protein